MSNDVPFVGMNPNKAVPEVDITPEELSYMIEDIIEQYEGEGDENRPPFTHVLAQVMMEVFKPGFIIIGSPVELESSDGYSQPADVGVMINRETNLTTSSVGHFLGLLSELIEETTDSGLLDLTELYKGKSDDEPT